MKDRERLKELLFNFIEKATSSVASDDQIKVLPEVAKILKDLISQP